MAGTGGKRNVWERGDIGRKARGLIGAGNRMKEVCAPDMF